MVILYKGQSVGTTTIILTTLRLALEEYYARKSLCIEIMPHVCPSRKYQQKLLTPNQPGITLKTDDETDTGRDAKA